MLRRFGAGPSNLSPSTHWCNPFLSPQLVPAKVRKAPTLLAAVVIALQLAGVSKAATTIGVNFQGRNETTSSASSPLGPNEVAGVVPQSHWNNVDDNAVNNNGTTAALVDSSGASTGVTLTFQANDSWSNDTDPNAITSGNARMMNGIMKAKTGTSETLTWNNLTGTSYDVYLYLSENGDGARVSVDDLNGTVYYATEYHRFTDADRFVQSTSTDPSNYPLANFVKFTGLAPVNGSITIVLTHLTGTDGAGLSGMQLVTPSGDIPVTIVTQPRSQTAAVGNSATFGVAAYGENNRYQWYKNGAPITGATSASYSTSALTAGDSGAAYHVVVSNGSNSQTSSDATLTVKPATTIAGSLRHEYYPGATRTAVENGIAGAPSFVEAIPSFSTAVNDGINNYSERVSGYFTPPVSGKYVFFVSADDDSDVFLSTDANPANKRLIAQENNWSNPLQWTISSGNSNLAQKRSDQFSPNNDGTTPFAEGIDLVGGTPYYIEGVHHQGTGGDNFSVTYKLVTDPDPVNADPANSIAGDTTRLTGNVISFKTTQTTSLSITQGPQNQTVTEGFIGTFTVTPQTDSELTPTYQWLRNGTPIPGATSRSYSFTTTAADNNTQYSVIVSVPGYGPTVTSSTATLTVRSPVFTSGFLKYEFWQSKSYADMTNNKAGAPTFVTAISRLSTTNNAGDPPSDYSDRITGYFVPAVAGNYVFFVGADDNADLYLSTDTTAANKRLIAQENGYSGYNNWNTPGGNGSSSVSKRSDQFANTQWPTGNTITLAANQRYYLEVDHHEGTGGDWMGVYAKLESDQDPADGTPSNLTGNRIGFFVAPANINITSAPASATVTEGWAASFSVAATTDSQVPIISYQWKRNGVDIPGANSSTYTTPILSQANNNDKYTVVVNAPGATATTTAAANLTVQPGVVSTGFLRYEAWPGKGLADVENNLAGIAPIMSALVRAQTTNSVADNYSDRISGYFIPPTTGNYVFFVGSDDDSNLYLSTDSEPANKKLIAHEAGWSSYANWTTAGGAGSVASDKRSDQFANTQWPGGTVITLNANQRYYIEIDHHEGTGGDWVGAYYKLEADADPANGTPSNLTGPQVAFSAHASTATITQQPQTFSGAEGFSATFSAAGTTTSEFPVLTYQWQRNGIDIPGATGTNYTTAPLTQANANDKYRVVVRAPGSAAVTSADAGVTLGTATLTSGIVKHEVWFGLNDRTIVEFGDPGVPSIVEELTRFETPQNIGDNYVDRLSGFFTPAVGGDYVFFLGADDDADLYLSTDNTPNNKKLIAHETGYSNPDNWTTVGGNGSNSAEKRSDQFGGTEWPTGSVITLAGNQSYYIELVHHDATGGDWAGAYVKLASAADPANGTTGSNLSGSVIASVGPQPTAAPKLAIQQTAGAINVTWTGNGTLQQATALTGNASDWSNVTGAANGSYTTPATGAAKFFRVVR
jgi:hypothetical protein